MNEHDWTTTFSSLFLQITHLQWIFRNIYFHDEEVGYLRRKQTETMKCEAEEMACMNHTELSAESRLLLEMDGIKTSKKTFAYHDLMYWLSAMRAVRIANNGRRKQKKAMNN